MTSAVILAGGLGTRLRSAVPDLPKPMAPIHGKPFLAHQMHYWITQGVDHFVLSLGYRFQSIVEYFGTKFEGVTLDYVIEESPLGTGGGLILASKKVNQSEYFLLLNGDTYFEVNFEDFVYFARKNNADWCFSLFRTLEVGRYMGIDISHDGQINSLSNNLSAVERLANGGVYLVSPSALSAIRFLPGEKLSLEEEIFPIVMSLGQRVFAMEFSKPFIDIGVPDDYRRSANLLPT
jgi:D-glycero-alpha-D-manno-heptose 1-phosphate guanylyltransferase